MARGFMAGAAVRLSLTSQSLACTTASAAITNPFSANVWAVRVAVSGTGNTHYRIDSGTPTAVTSDPFLPNTEIEYVMVSPSQKLAAITESGTATVTVTELVQ